MCAAQCLDRVQEVRVTSPPLPPPTRPRKRRLPSDFCDPSLPASNQEEPPKEYNVLNILCSPPSLSIKLQLKLLPSSFPISRLQEEILFLEERLVAVLSEEVFELGRVGQLDFE